MPSYSRPSGGTGPSSSFEEKNTPLPCSASTNDLCPPNDATDHVALEQERIERSNDVRQRLGPLIEKLKDSVKNIQTIENSIRVSADGNSDGQMADKDKTKTFRSERSQKLIDQSMEMVKKKMFRLKSMEEQLMLFEDRNLNLNHYFQQQLSQQSVEEKLELPKGESEYRDRIHVLEEEVRLLKEKSALVDGLRMKNERLLERTKDVERLEQELMAEKSLRQVLESKLNEGDGYMLANSTQILEVKENEIMNTIMLQRMCLAKNMNSSGTIEGSDTNESTTLTEPMSSLSWTESSVSTDDASTHDMNNSNASEGSTSPSTVEILMAKIDTLIRENAELRDSKNVTLNKYKSLRQEMKKQSMLIESLHRKVGF